MCPPDTFSVDLLPVWLLQPSECALVSLQKYFTSSSQQQALHTSEEICPIVVGSLIRAERADDDRA